MRPVAPKTLVNYGFQLSFPVTSAGDRHGPIPVQMYLKYYIL